MKIVEGLKRMRVIEKKLVQNADNVTRYASMVSTEKPLFETDVKQKKEVNSLLQSSNDLLTEYLGIKRKVEETNLAVFATIDGTKYSLSDLLIIKRKMASQMMFVYQSLNDTEGKKRLGQVRGWGAGEGGNTPTVVRFYKEEDKNAGLKKWQELYDNIDSRLEVINATTDMIE